MPVSTTYQTVLTEQAEGVLTITLNRPESYNALNEQLKDDLLDALKAASRDASVRCVVLTGAGKAFCSGQDLKEARPGEIAIGDALRKKYNPIARLLYGMEKPVLAAVNGVAAGAGCSLALLCDMRIMADTASFRLAFSSIGLAPDSGACFILPRLVGRGLALELAYTGRAVDAEEALRIGLANQVVAQAELPERTAQLARTLAARPTRALGLTKRAINHAMDVDLDAALDYEAYTQEIAAATLDFAEGAAAFREKRTPRFEGR
jgi:2-(1,2-epoxy-1,2-dihydrophenyl)acetyl-CoA isomerase